MSAGIQQVSKHKRGVSTYDDAVEWARRFAAACRCAQEVRLLMDDPEV